MSTKLSSANHPTLFTQECNSQEGIWKTSRCDTMRFVAGKPGHPEESEKLLQTKH